MFLDNHKLRFSCLGMMATAIAAAGGQSQNARDVLLACMQNGNKVNVSAVILQRDPGVDGGFQRVQMQRSRDGKSKHTILQPLRLQGTQSVDDGATMMVYLPNDRVVMKRESSGNTNSDIVQRMDLAAKNYTFRFETKTRVADRVALCVVATPVNKGLDVRRFYIDEEELFPLKLETQQKGVTRTLYETKYIEYPKSVPDSVFRVNVTKDAREYRYARPQNCRNKDEAASLVGFLPLVPRLLPFGFQMQDVQVESSSSTKKVMLQLTDGLARATIFQWKNDGNERKMKTTEDFSVGERNGIRVMVVSDLEEEIRLKLLNAFIKQMTSIPEPSYHLIGFRGMGLLQAWELPVRNFGCNS